MHIYQKSKGVVKFRPIVNFDFGKILCAFNSRVSLKNNLKFYINGVDMSFMFYFENTVNRS